MRSTPVGAAVPVRHWLLKTEADCYSIDDLERDGRTAWTGVRNHQARNFMRAMAVGDQAIVYHSNAKPPGAAGVAKVVGKAYPDPTAFDRRDEHFDPKSNPEAPTWENVDVAFVRRFPQLLPLDRLKEARPLQDMLLLSGKAMRLSIQPMGKRHFDAIVRMVGR